MELEQKIQELSTELKGFVSKRDEEIKTLGAVTNETKVAVDTLVSKGREMQTQLDALDAKVQEQGRIWTPERTPSLGELFTKHEKYLAAKAADFSIRQEPLHIGINSMVPQVDLKSTISGIGSQTTGIQPLQRLQVGPIMLPQQELRIRDLLSVRPMTSGTSFDYVRQTTRTNAPSPQAETVAKAESTYGWTAYSGVVRTIAHFTNVSRQALDDIPWMRNILDAELTYGLKLKEEAEILAGDGTGEHLNGLITQATAYSTQILTASAGWTRLDILRDAKLQCRLAGLATFAPTGIVLHPADMARIELTKDANGLYIIGDPVNGPAVKMVWGLPVVESDSITNGTFLIGAFATAATLIDRMALTLMISYEHNVNFTTNMATILAEERIGLAVTRPTAFVTGSFSTSPE